MHVCYDWKNAIDQLWVNMGWGYFLTISAKNDFEGGTYGGVSFPFATHGY